MRNPIEAIEVEHGLAWTAAIMAALVFLEGHGGEKFDYLQDMRGEQGIGGDAMTAGFMYLAIAAGKYLDTRIENYDEGVFSYEHLENGKGELPWVFIEQLTPEEWYRICCNWDVPQERIEAIIDAWLDGPRFDSVKLAGSFELRPKISELRQFEVDVHGFVLVSRRVTVTAANMQAAANDALANTSRLPEGWSTIGEAVTQSHVGGVTEVAGG